MFAIWLLILISGLMSIIPIALMTSVYGILLLVLANMIRSVRQETSRSSLRRFLTIVAYDHLLSAATLMIAICVLLLIGYNPSGEAGWLDNLAENDKSVVASLVTIPAVLIVVYLFVGCLLLKMIPDLAERASIQNQLRWHPWTTVLIVIGLILNLSSLGLMLLITLPLLWHLIRIDRNSRQLSLIWTLAIAVRQGLPLGPEIAQLADGLWGRKRLRLQLLAENLDAGLSLATALERQPGLVPLSHVMLIRMGEETNMLASALEICTVGLDRKHDREVDIANVQHAFLILLIPAIAIPQIVGFLCYYIMPKFKRIFEDFGMELPRITTDFIRITDGAAGYGFGGVGLLLLAVNSVALFWMIVFISFRDWERDWPLINLLAPQINGPPILRSLALLIQQQRPLAAGVQALSWSHPRESAKFKLSGLYRQLLQGIDLPDALASQELIRRGDVPLLRAGERLQNLPWVLRQLADAMEKRFWYRFRLFLEAGYPVCVGIIGLIVLLVVLAFFMPLVHLIDSIA